MRILFFLKHPGTLRNLGGTVELLAQRGHELHLAFDSLEGGSAKALLEELVARHPGITMGTAPKGSADEWGRLTKLIRSSLDYLRYLEPEYSAVSKLRERARSQAPAPVRRLAQTGFLQAPRPRRAAVAALRVAERAMPTPKVLDEFISGQQPDIVLVTPLVGIGSRQAGYVRSAKIAGIPTGLCVLSWDNLTNKGLIHDAPDMVAVWNEAQAVEAVDLHRVPREKVVVTGAVAYDHWFDWVATRPVDDLCAHLGLRPDLPYVLYVCSSPFIAREEVAFVTDWLAALRSSGVPELAEIGVLIRPHPQHAAQWRGADLGPQTAIHPRDGGDPISTEARSTYFDSLMHSTAVIGINTSAMIEAAVVGKPVMSIVTDEFRSTQDGTLHFAHLADSETGVLEVARSLEEHVQQLHERLRTPTSERTAPFVRRFVRPYGIEEAAGPRLVGAIEALGGTLTSPRRMPLWVPVVRLALRPLAIRVSARQKARRAAVKAKSRAARAKAAREAAARGGLREPDRILGPETARAMRRLPSGVALTPSGPTGLSEPVGRKRSFVDNDGVTGVDAAHEAVRRLSSGNELVLAGPWFSEVGFELLYWVPFLNWALGEDPGLAARTVVLSRGGSHHWYEHLGVRYLDLFEDHDPARLRIDGEAAAAAAQRGLRKQMTTTEFDARLLSAAAAHLSNPEPATLHPSVMYKAYWHLVKSRAIQDPATASVFRHRPMLAPDPGLLRNVLPERFVAVRFYFSSAFPETRENVVHIEQTIKQLTSHTDVVLLNPGISVDDHWDFETSGGRIVRLDEHMTAMNNLHLQTIAISRAAAFVGTYGGLSYLPPLLGVPSIGLYSETTFKPWHLGLAANVYNQPPFGSLTVVATGQFTPGQIVAAATAARPAPPLMPDLSR